MKTVCTPSFYLLLAFLAAFNLPADAQLTTLAYTGTIQTYYVPAGVTSIGIGVMGGSGGSSSTGSALTHIPALGGYAASMYGIFAVTPGQTLKVLVGGAGQTANYCGGGGGGSFVWDSATHTLLIAAGGGGGAGCSDVSSVSIPGLSANTGDIAINGNTMPSGAGSGGGGGVSNGAYDYGAAGAGWLSSGHAGYNPVSCTNATSGFTPLAGGAGGSFGGAAGADGNGGFGGGGGAQGRCSAVGGGGGGGYSGGGAGGELTSGNEIYQSGGGGGSYNVGTNQSNSIATDTGNGVGEIKICPTNISSTAGTSMCIGGSITLSSDATGGLWTGYGGIVVTPDGIATGASAGTGVISYKVPNCPAVSEAVTINPSPRQGVIEGSDMLCTGSTTVLLESISGGVWSSSNTGVATINASLGITSGVSDGIIDITYTVTDAATGCSAFTLFPLAVTPPCNEGVKTITAKGHSGINVYPNPNNGRFQLLISTLGSEQATVTITNILGVKVKEFTIATNSPDDMQLDTPPGVYFLNAATANGRWSEKIQILPAAE